jgi:hypothetical protein
MKKLFRALVFLAMGMLLIACGQSVTATPSPIPSPSATVTPTLVPTQTATATIEPTPEHVQPTLIPTIDLTLLPELLGKALSIQTVDVNGNNSQRITGWEHGFGADIWYANCPSYVWLDTNHLLLYPGAGQEHPPEGMGMLGVNVVPQPVVMNLETGSIWLPPVDISSGLTCNRVFWSHDLGILINSGIYNGTPAVFTHTFDGKKLANYRGQFTQVSPSKEKILIDNNILIDLRTNSRTTLTWPLEDYEEQMLSGVFWTSDETRLYRCCYFYADLNTGTSFRFGNSDFQDRNGNPLEYEGLWPYRGRWVKNDAFFLATWSMVDDGDIRYLPLFDPDERTLYDVRQMAGISKDLSCPETNISTNGSYIWVECYEKHYLVNLTTFEANEYLIPGYSNSDIDWSMDEKFALIDNYNFTNETTQYYLLSLSNKELNTLPIMNPISIPWQHPWWHSTDDVFAYINENARKFELFNAQTITVQEITFPTTLVDFVWSFSGERIALIAEDGSLWQIDYPKMENLEQLTSALPDVRDVQWAPDDKSIAFLSGSDIYIVNATK